MHRHEGLDWEKIEQKLKAKPEKLCSLNEMERTEGEPDVVGYDEQADQYIFCDCSKESPKGRRSVCYDRAALEARKKHKPKNSAMDMANELFAMYLFLLICQKNIGVFPLDVVGVFD